MKVNELYNEDCLITMAKMPKDFIDLIITSPPYEDVMGAGYSSNSKDVLFLKLYSDFIDKVFLEYYRIIKNNGQIFFNIKSKTFNKTLNTPHWIEHLESFKKFKFKSYIIWKYAGSFDSSKKRFHLDYEIIYHLSKGDDINLNLDCGIHDPLSSVWYVPHNIKKEERMHPTQMPYALVDRILKVASKENDLVLDNFMGSGTTILGCKNYNLNYIGIELNPINYNNAKKRLNTLI